MVDLGGYVIILLETKDKKMKLYGSPADKENLEVADEILEVNGKNLEDATHTECISHIHQCIRSRTIFLRVKRKTGARLAVDLDLSAGHVQDAFVIAVEQQARERLERLSALKRITPIDISKLQNQLSQHPTTTVTDATDSQAPAASEELNGYISAASPIYVTSLTAAASGAQLGLPQENLNNNKVAVVEAVPSHQQGRRASSPFQNGRTELLINAEDNRQIKENNNNSSGNGVKLAQGELPYRPRRRSGSSIVVLGGGEETELEVKRPLPAPAEDMVMMLAAPGDGTQQHREMAVDVPDSFIARNKTPPRYPPPKPPPTQTIGGSAVNGSAVKPVPPPRDHIKLDKTGSGRTVMVAAPTLPARVNNNNNSIPAAVVSPPPVIVSAEPTREQLDSIKKYQEQLRKRKEEEERQAAENEFLNRSLRGSRKLLALESQPQGLVNDAFSVEDDETKQPSSTATTRSATPAPPTQPPPPLPAEKEIVHTIYTYGDLVASVQRLQLQLKKAGVGGEGTTDTANTLASSLEGRVAAVQSLLLSPQFGRALAVHNRVQAVRQRLVTGTRPCAQQALRECLDAVAQSQSVLAIELSTLLSGYEIEALMVAHDKIASDTLAEDDWQPSTPPSFRPPIDKPVPQLSADQQQLYGDDNIKVIKIEKSTEPLGATVRNEGDSVVIGRVVRGGAADKSGLLHEGDELLEVNGIEMRGKSINTVCDILQAMEGTLTFLVVPGGRGHPHPHHRDGVLHVRAHFEYNPEDDMYIPCRELGIGFQKGDVLHVISQDDPNWWQAYREGEEDQTLAGLIPSQTFQHQRETMRLGAEERLQSSSSRRQHKASTLLCGGGVGGRRGKRSAKHRPPHEGGYPILGGDAEYGSSVEDAPQEVLTYEEVSLYYPRAGHRRPIVLIGPPNIGRHELRQRLMEDAERFAAAVPHTSRARKDNEVDGQDYHFITRAQFEADILSRKFVEHGEYEKAYYGTSLDAIRSVVNAGKICVLNLHPQSLRILRTSDLKPYVVFVAPPSLEKLRQKRIRSGEAYKEEELKDIIEKAREMEDRYGHYFDMIIVNNDTERAYHQLLGEINSLEREPQWVPAAWVKAL